MIKETKYFLTIICIYLLIGSCSIYAQTKGELVKLNLEDKTISLSSKNNENQFVLSLKKGEKILDQYDLYADNTENLDIQLIDLDNDQIKEVIIYIDEDGGSSSYSYDQYKFFKVVNNKLIYLGSRDCPQSNKKSLTFEKGIITIPFLRMDYENVIDILGYIDASGNLFSDKSYKNPLNLTHNYQVINGKLINLPTVVKDNKNIIIHSKVENNIPYISIKDISEVLGYKVHVNNKTKTMSISNNISISFNSKKAMVNNKVIELKYLPKNFLNTAMVSLEDFSTLFNIHARYFKDYNIITIDSSRNPINSNTTYRENLKTGYIPELDYKIGDSINKVYSKYGKPNKTYGYQTTTVSDYTTKGLAVYHNYDDENQIVQGLRFNQNQTIYGIKTGDKLNTVKTILGKPDYEDTPSEHDGLAPINSTYVISYETETNNLTIYFDDKNRVQCIYVKSW